MGDPQAPFAKVLAVLDRHAALDGDRLADDVVLVSIGDHFDYDHRDPETAGLEGLRVLGWLASHAPAQVLLLLGNHDAARVMELATLSDAEFARARALARAIDAAPDDAAARAAYAAEFPTLPPPGVVARDYASFCAAQRELVIELLLAGRFHLALAGELGGRAALLTHAGVTARELALLGRSAADGAAAIAAALDGHLAAAVERVRADWERGVPAPLSLAPLHVTGGDGREGGGLLYHRPSNPASGSTFDPERPRRYDPRTLPAGLVQIAGHSGHAKCVHELGAWCSRRALARAHGGIRTLRVAGGTVTYDLGIGDGASDLILIDGELRRVPAAEVDLLELARVA